MVASFGHKLTDRFEVARARDDRRKYLGVFELIPSRLNPWFFGKDRRHCWILSEPTSYAAARYSGKASTSCAKVFCGAD